MLQQNHISVTENIMFPNTILDPFATQFHHFKQNYDNGYYLQGWGVGLHCVIPNCPAANIQDGNDGCHASGVGRAVVGVPREQISPQLLKSQHRTFASVYF